MLTAFTDGMERVILTDETQPTSLTEKYCVATKIPVCDQLSPRTTSFLPEIPGVSESMNEGSELENCVRARAWKASIYISLSLG